MLKQLFSLAIIALVDTKIQMDPRVVQGDVASITKFAHSAFLVIDTKIGSYVCGSSIVNQKILLTAAHCIDSCTNKCVGSTAFTGNANKRNGEKIYILRSVFHEKFNRVRVQNDIGLVLLKNSLRLGTMIKRVALMKNPPSPKVAIVAGWGLTNEVRNTHTDYLHSVRQNVWNYKNCQKMIPNIPNGTICAGDVKSQRYASEGDSGSALIINDYIQIGLVSYKRPDISRAIVVYTDVAYFYDWIKYNSRKLYCNHA